MQKYTQTILNVHKAILSFKIIAVLNLLKSISKNENEKEREKEMKYKYKNENKSKNQRSINKSGRKAL